MWVNPNTVPISFVVSLWDSEIASNFGSFDNVRTVSASIFPWGAVRPGVAEKCFEFRPVVRLGQHCVSG